MTRPTKLAIVLGFMILAGVQPALGTSASAARGDPKDPTFGGEGLGLGANPFGVFFGQRGPKVGVAEDLGAAFAREVVPMGLWEGAWGRTCPNCTQYTDAGLELVLTVKTALAHGLPSGPPQDLASYQATLGDILDATRPKVLVVENEMDNNAFWTGTPEEYLALLRAGCEVAHRRGIACADGGLLWPTVVRMVYQDRLDAGDVAGAAAYVERAYVLNPVGIVNVLHPANAENVRRWAERGHRFLDGFAAAGADYVNFHWYGPEPVAFAETVAYLGGATGLRVGTNELGHHDHHNPTSVLGQMAVALELDMPFVVWYSVDHGPNYALQNPDDSLRAHGLAFKGFVLASDLVGHAGNTTAAQTARSVPPGP